MADKFVYEINKQFGDNIIEEGANTSILLRRIAWGEAGKEKLDLRKWSYQEEGKERAMKGVTLTDEGADELTGVLCEKGYGNTKRIIRALSKRDNFNDALNTYNEADNGFDDDGSEDFYDPKELLGSL